MAQSKILANLAMRFGADVSDLKKGTKSAAKSIKQLGRDAREQGVELAKWGAAATTAAAGVTAAMMKMNATAGKELRNLSMAANTGVVDFQNLANAGQRFGIDAEKMGDILKDVNDRVGDFLTTGGGPMADFFEQIAPKVGITADAFKGLSGKEALQLYVSSLEKANASQSEMTFFMEAMASDSTRLLPLLKDNGKAVAELSKHFDDLGLNLSEVQVSQLTMLDDSITDAQKTADAFGKHLSSKLSPVVIGVIENFEDWVKEMGGMDKVAELAFNNLIDGAGFVLNAIHGVKVSFEVLKETIYGAFSFSKGVIAEFVGDTLELLSKIPGVDFSGMSLSMQQVADESFAAFDQSLANIHEKLMQPLPADAFRNWVAEQQEIFTEKAAVDAERRQTELAEANTHQAALTESEKKGAKARVSAWLQEQKQKEVSAQATFGHLSTLMNSESKKLFQIGKIAAISSAIISGIEAAIHSFKFGAMIGGPILGGAFAAMSLAATGVQIQAIRSQQFGGGGSSAVAGGGLSATQQVNAVGQQVDSGGGGQRNIYVQGINPDQMFSGRQLVDMINVAQEDGAVLRLA